MATKSTAKRGQLSIPGKSKLAPEPVPEPSKVSASREGKAAIPFWAPTAARTQLRIMAAEQDRTMQDLLTEGLNDLFAKHNKPRIA